MLMYVYWVCLGNWEASAKWSGEWQISRNFGACGAAGKFFSKFRETLANPKPSCRKQVHSNSTNSLTAFLLSLVFWMLFDSH